MRNLVNWLELRLKIRKSVFKGTRHLVANDHFGAKMKREALPDHSKVYFSKKFNMTILNPNPKILNTKEIKKTILGVLNKNCQKLRNGKRQY